MKNSIELTHPRLKKRTALNILDLNDIAKSLDDIRIDKRKKNPIQEVTDQLSTLTLDVSKIDINQISKKLQQLSIDDSIAQINHLAHSVSNLKSLIHDHISKESKAINELKDPQQVRTQSVQLGVVCTAFYKQIDLFQNKLLQLINGEALPNTLIFCFLSKSFDTWVNRYPDNQPSSDDQKLLNFMSCDSGFKYIRSYSDFCDFAAYIQKDFSYSFSTPTCSQHIFNQDKDRYFERSRNKKYMDSIENPRSTPILFRDPQQITDEAKSLIDTILSLSKDAHKSIEKTTKDIENGDTVTNSAQTLLLAFTLNSKYKAISHAKTKLAKLYMEGKIKDHLIYDFLAKEFNAWVNRYPDNQPSSDSDKLINFLSGESEFRFIQNHSQLCGLAQHISSTLNYELSSPPCTQEEFNSTKRRHSLRSRL